MSAYELYDIYYNKRDYENKEYCIICFTENSDCILWPCRHLCLCNICATSIAADTNQINGGNFVCPMCRITVTKVIYFNTTVPIPEFMSSLKKLPSMAFSTPKSMQKLPNNNKVS